MPAILLKSIAGQEKENNKQKKCKSYKIQKQATKYKNRLTVYFFIDKINYHSLQEADKKRHRSADRIYQYQYNVNLKRSCLLYGEYTEDGFRSVQSGRPVFFQKGKNGRSFLFCWK